MFVVNINIPQSHIEAESKKMVLRKMIFLICVLVQSHHSVSFRCALPVYPEGWNNTA